ncbi:MAG: TetR/AcrR family transcriptional regulator [Mycobacterium sp.]
MVGDDMRAHIMDAALETLALPARGLSVADVCARARVSRSTVYHHFGNKDGLLRAIGMRMADLFKEALDDRVRAQPDPDIRLEVVIDALTDVGHRHPEALQLLVREPGFGMDFMRTLFAEFVDLIDQLIVVALEGPRGQRYAGVDSAEAAELIVRIVMSAYLLPAATPAVGVVRSVVSAELLRMSSANNDATPGDRPQRPR